MINFSLYGLMAKYKLTLEEDYDFDLIGLCSNHADYRLCWAINQALDTSLSKADDYEVINKKEGAHHYSFYEYYDETDHISYTLIKNVSNNYKALIPEKEQIDYFLIVKNNAVYDPNTFLEKLKAVDSVLTAFIFDPDELKSKANLIF